MCNKQNKDILAVLDIPRDLLSPHNFYISGSTKMLLKILAALKTNICMSRCLFEPNLFTEMGPLREMQCFRSKHSQNLVRIHSGCRLCILGLFLISRRFIHFQYRLYWSLLKGACQPILSKLLVVMIIFSWIKLSGLQHLKIWKALTESMFMISFVLWSLLWNENFLSPKNCILEKVNKWLLTHKITNNTQGTNEEVYFNSNIQRLMRLTAISVNRSYSHVSMHIGK